MSASVRSASFARAEDVAAGRPKNGAVTAAGGRACWSLRIPIAPPLRRARNMPRAASRFSITVFPVDARRRLSVASRSGLSSGRATTPIEMPSAPVPSAAHSQFPRCAVRKQTPRPVAKDAFATGRGVCFLTAHLGNWEWAALGTGALGISIGVVARPLDNPLLDATLKRLRASTGNTVIEKRDAARGMLRALRSGGAIGILNDQHARPPDAVTAPFFGRPAATSSALAKLADRTEALIVPAYTIRVAPARWRLTYEPPLDVRTLSREERADVQRRLVG